MNRRGFFAAVGGALAGLILPERWSDLGKSGGYVVPEKFVQSIELVAIQHGVMFKVVKEKSA